MTVRRPAADFEIVGEFGRTGEGSAYLARDRSTGELVAVRPAGDDAAGLAVADALDSSIPATSRNCPICRVPIADWRRFCDQCGADLSGVDVAPEGLDARRLVERALESSDQPVDLLGPIRRSEGGGDVWFGRNRRTGEVLAIDLTRGQATKRTGGTFGIAVTALTPAGSPSTAAERTAPPESARATASAQAGAPVAGPAVKVCPTCGKDYSATVRFCPDDGAVLRLREAPDSIVGAIVANRYLIQRKIGQGGMGRVYLAGHVRMGRRCAIKVLSRELSNDVQAVSRFAREATNASRINDVHVAHIYDFGETPEHGVYLAMEFVDGQPLAGIIATEGPLPDRRSIGIAVQVARALEAAHAEGVVHRDLTPNNIMVARNHDGSDLVKVVDFGIAKATEDMGSGLTRTGFVIGTPQYMSPEQFVAEPVDGRSDIYQLGCVLYEMLVGSPPFGATGGPEQLAARLIAEPPDPAVENASVPRELSDIVVRALARDRGARYQSAIEIRDALVAVAGTGFQPQLVPDVPPTGAVPTVAPESTAAGTEPPPAPRVSESAPVSSQPIASGGQDAQPPVEEAPTIVQRSPAAVPPLSRPRREAGTPPPARNVIALKSLRGVLSHRATAASLTAAALLVLAVLYGTVVAPIRVGPFTLGFGGTPPSRSADRDTAVPEVPEPDPVDGEQPPAEPTGIQLTAALPPGTTVRVDGQEVATVDNFIALDPGTHQVEIRAAGFVPVRTELTVAVSGASPWTPRFERIPVAAVSPSTNESTLAAEPRRSRDQERTAESPPPRSTTTAPEVPVSFADAVNSDIEKIRRAIESKDLTSIRPLLKSEDLAAFDDVLGKSGSARIRVTTYGIEADSARTRAMFFMRIDQGGNVLMDVKEFAAEFIRVSGMWQLWAVERSH